tara:strand:+ start:1143 stop:1523 length:381 start_codon:yes stop_codon:yes gene_type:complete
MNECQGSNFIKSPKHPQSVTLLKYAEKNVKNVKHNINIKLPHITLFTCIPNIKKIAKNISKRIIKIDRNKLKGINQSKPNTSKYSCSLYENPKGSISLTKPEKIKKEAYEKRIKLIIKGLEISLIK